MGKWPYLLAQSQPIHYKRHTVDSKAVQSSANGTKNNVLTWKGNRQDTAMFDIP